MAPPGGGRGNGGRIGVLLRLVAGRRQPGKVYLLHLAVDVEYISLNFGEDFQRATTANRRDASHRQATNGCSTWTTQVCWAAEPPPRYVAKSLNEVVPHRRLTVHSSS